MRGFERIRKQFLAGFLLVLFIGYAGSITLFQHTHLVNGQQITHSHPYADAPDTGRHTHTASGFTAIALLSALLMLSLSIGLLAKPFLSAYAIKAIVVVRRFSSLLLSGLFLRAPPAC